MASGPSLPTVKRLSADSRNVCAFSGCEMRLVTEEGVVVGRICHIRAASKRGPRYDEMPVEQRHAYENLVLLCGPHHDEIDRLVGEWTAERLTALKQDHEAAGTEAVGKDEERICKQLIEIERVYQIGINIGSITAQHVQVAHGDIINTTPYADKLAPGATADRRTLDSLIKQLSEVVEFIRIQDFTATFQTERLRRAHAFLGDRSRPDCEFLNPEIEKHRRALIEALSRFLDLIAVRTFPTDGPPGINRIARPEELRNVDWETAEARWHRDRRQLHGAAERVAETFDQLVRFARRELEA